MKISIQSGATLGPLFETETDVLVIGSGAGGAVAVHTLAKAGRKVMCLEEGAHVTSDQFSGRQLEATRQLYRLDGMTVALGRPATVIPMGCSIGGTTTINAGTSFRTPDERINGWKARYGHSATPEEMGPHFDAIEKLMPVAKVPAHLLGGNSEAVAKGCQALGWSGAPIPRNAPTCDGCCRCVLGCPEDAKLSMNISFVPAGIAAGATYLSRMRVHRIVHTNGKATAVEGDLLADDSRSAVGKFRIRAKTIVVSAGAIYSPILLRRSGLQHGSRHVGKHLRLHPATRAIGVFDHAIEGWKGVLQGYYVDEFEKEGVKMEGVFVPPGLLAAALPFFGADNFEIMRNYANMAIFGTMAQDDSPGAIDGEILGMPRIRYQLTQADADKIVKGVWAIGRIYFAAGARKVYAGIYRHESFSNVDELDKLLKAKIPPSYLETLSMHPHGSVPMAASTKLEAVDLSGKVYGTQNVYVADGSIFPEALGVNPQFSIMGYARRMAEGIAKSA